MEMLQGRAWLCSKSCLALARVLCREREPAPKVLTSTGVSSAEILGNVPFLDIQKILLELKATRVSPASGPTNAKL